MLASIVKHTIHLWGSDKAKRKHALQGSVILTWFCQEAVDQYMKKMNLLLKNFAYVWKQAQNLKSPKKAFREREDYSESESSS